MDKKKISKIRSGIFDRSFTMGKVAVKSGASFAANRIKNLWAEEEQKKSSFHLLLESQAKLLAGELGRLKGSLMKMGQMLALYGEHFFPEEVVKVLQSLNEDSPPLEWSAIEPILKRRMSAEQLEDLEIDSEALAAASMGQVHKAIVKKTGEAVCIKIQYPGVSKAIDNDIKTLKSVLSMLRLIPTHTTGFDEMMKEVRAMLRQEVDYQRELKFTEQMSELLKDYPLYKVPNCFENYSGSKILTTSFESGVNLNHERVLSLSEERRGQLAAGFVSLLLMELFDFHLVQTDPHFGNYKIHIGDSAEEDRIILLDFGAVRRFSKKFIGSYKKMAKGALLGDDEMTLEGALQVGFLNDDDNEKHRECFLKIAYAAVEPFLSDLDPRWRSDHFDEDGLYRWGESQLPKRITDLATEYAFTFKLRPPPREVVFLDRKLGGMFIILQKLNARFDASQMIDKYILD